MTQVPRRGAGMTLRQKREKEGKKWKDWFFYGGGIEELVVENRVSGIGGSNQNGLSHLSAVGLYWLTSCTYSIAIVFALISCYYEK